MEGDVVEGGKPCGVPGGERLVPMGLMARASIEAPSAGLEERNGGEFGRGGNGTAGGGLGRAVVGGGLVERGRDPFCIGPVEAAWARAMAAASGDSESRLKEGVVVPSRPKDSRDVEASERLRMSVI